MSFLKGGHSHPDPAVTGWRGEILLPAELRTFVEGEAASLVGAQLQEVIANDRGFALGFWLKGLRWLVVDLLPQSPLAFVFDDCPFVKGPKPKPFGLFLNSHGRDKVLRGIEVLEEFGRVVRLQLSNAEGECEIELHLIPKQANAIVRAGGKQVAWEKPKALSPAPQVSEYPPARSMTDIRDEWLLAQTQQRKPAQDPEEQWRQKRDRDLGKKRKALGEIEKQLSLDASAQWYTKGDELKAGSGELVDPTKSLAWNIDHAYSKAKQAAAKRKGAEERRQLLIAEIDALEKTTFASARKEPRTSSADLLRKADAKARTLVLENGVTAFIGKSAADNLALLRKARAWDYWLHLRDYPGAHAILHRQKDQTVSDSDVQKIAQWLAREALGRKILSTGGKLAVVLAECRFVRPIKGDRLGRVTYHHERHVLVEV